MKNYGGQREVHLWTHDEKQIIFTYAGDDKYWHVEKARNGEVVNSSQLSLDDAMGMYRIVSWASAYLMVDD